MPQPQNKPQSQGWLKIEGITKKKHFFVPNLHSLCGKYQLTQPTTTIFVQEKEALPGQVQAQASADQCLACFRKVADFLAGQQATRDFIRRNRHLTK